MLKVEDGTGGDAFVSLADFKEYCADVGHDLSAFTDEDEERAIRRASTYVSASFRYKGLPVGYRAQKLAWPRFGATDQYGVAIDFTTIPREAAAATCEAAWYELNSPNGLAPTVVIAERVLAESVGPISVQYESRRGLGSDVADSRPILTIVGDLLAPLVDPGALGVTARAERG